VVVVCRLSTTTSSNFDGFDDFDVRCRNGNSRAAAAAAAAVATMDGCNVTDHGRMLAGATCCLLVRWLASCKMTAGCRTQWSDDALDEVLQCIYLGLGWLNERTKLLSTVDTLKPTHWCIWELPRHLRLIDAGSSSTICSLTENINKSFMPHCVGALGVVAGTGQAVCTASRAT